MNGNIGFGPAGTFLQNLHDLRVGHAPYGLAVDLYEDVTLLEVFAPGKKMVLIFFSFQIDYHHENIYQNRPSPTLFRRNCLKRRIFRKKTALMYQKKYVKKKNSFTIVEKRNVRCTLKTMLVVNKCIFVRN